MTGGRAVPVLILGKGKLSKENSGGMGGGGSAVLNQGEKENCRGAETGSLPQSEAFAPLL